MRKSFLAPAITVAISAIVPLVGNAADWPFWGGTSSRNMVSPEVGLPQTWDAGRYVQGSEEIDMATTRNVKWVAKLGSQTYGNMTIAKGKVLIGTNNEVPRDPRLTGDRAVLLCLEEQSGKMLWQLAIPKLGTGKISDWEFLGLCSSPAIDGDKVYVVTNRCEVLCLDLNGMANGNDGPYQDEAKYSTLGTKQSITMGPQDADILWRFDMRRELGVFPHNITNCGPLIVGDKVIVTTSNGVDWTHTNMPNPKAPALAMLDKNTGALLGEENSGVSGRTLHSNWSSAAGGQVSGKDIVIFGGGDGYCYGLDTKTTLKGNFEVMDELWRFDCNPAAYRKDKTGKPIKYATFNGPSEVIATPVLYKEKVYVPIGQDPEHGEGLGSLVCIDPSKRGNFQKTGLVWRYDKIHRSLSTPSIVGNLMFVADFSGFIHCVDVTTGKPYWVFDSKSHIWASTLVADGKLYVGTEDGDVIVLAATKQMKELGRYDMRAPVYSTSVAANGTLYVATPTHLYAIGKSKTAQAPVDHKSAAARAQLARMETNAAKARAEHREVTACLVDGRSAVKED
jgi:outer membrane protein assembly factor BamB